MGILSSILVEIYFKELDIFMEAKIKRFNEVVGCVDFGNNSCFGFRKLVYVRYLDDFLVGVVSSYEEVLTIQGEVREFLRRELLLEVKDMKLGRVRHASFLRRFLGVLVRVV